MPGLDLLLKEGIDAQNQGSRARMQNVQEDTGGCTAHHRCLGNRCKHPKVTAQTEIETYHLKAMPGLVINDRVVCEGRIPHAGEVIRWVCDEMEAM